MTIIRLKFIDYDQQLILLNYVISFHKISESLINFVLHKVKYLITLPEAS